MGGEADGVGCVVGLGMVAGTAGLLYLVASWLGGSADPAVLIAALYATWATAPIILVFGGATVGFVLVMFALGGIYFRDWWSRPNWENPPWEKD
jgi:hypothetical protein